ncbi:ribonuclease H-like protein [Exidia glandulosa HHB12029]|uniref:ribonuclease H n=1 Tax=Exidia glandulosa HHB12029 TaxID=1314781 RepID=A0A165L5C6_EXIGL|nr:ribonuclease H-like protein [Exidia glandulosa HHB12029]
MAKALSIVNRQVATHPYRTRSAPGALESSLAVTPTNRQAVDSATSVDARLGLREADVEDESKWLVLYTDGACTFNGDPDARAGVGVWFGEDDKRNICERCPGKQTNNRAELVALIRALETADDVVLPILLKTDSAYCVRCVREWSKEWARNNWRKRDRTIVRNHRLIRYLLELLNFRHLLGQRVRLQWVKAHKGTAGNEAADTLSRVGALLEAKREPDWNWLRLELEKCWPDYYAQGGKDVSA